jgi:16S rRNA processing protein RimM
MAKTAETTRDPSLLSVGYITKPHGLKGDVLVHLTTNRTERVEPGTKLTTDHGVLEVLTSATQGDRWRVRFVGIEGRLPAEAICGRELFAAPLDDPDALWIHELIGAEVRLQSGEPVGKVASVEANPASDLLVLVDGRLIPLFFVTDMQTGIVTIDPPVGLLDFDDAAEARDAGQLSPGNAKSSSGSKNRGVPKVGKNEKVANDSTPARETNRP